MSIKGKNPECIAHVSPTFLFVFKMVDNLTFSSKVEEHNSTDIPSGWLDSGRKLTIIAGKYLKNDFINDNYYL
jgi:hypothetical protein